MVVRELVRTDHVAAAELDRIEAEAARREIEQALHDEHAVLPARPAHGRHNRLVREGDPELALVARHPVGPEKRALGVDGDRETVGVVRSRVVDEDVPHAQDPAVARDRDLRLVQLSPLLGGGEEVLVPVLDPLHGPSQLDRGPGDEDLLRVEHDLRAETAAHEGGDEPHLRLRQAERRGDDVAHRNGGLRRVPHLKPVGPRIPLGHDGPVLDRAPDSPVIGEASLQDEIGPGAGGGVVPLRLPDVRGEVRREVVVDPRRALIERPPEVHHGVERFDVRFNELGRVLGHVAALGDDHGQRLALMPDPLADEGQRRAGVEHQPFERRRWHEHRARPEERAEIGGREDGVDPGVRPRALHVEPAQPAGRQVAAHEGDVQRAGRLNVLDELGAAGQEARVLVARHPRPDPRPARPAHAGPVRLNGRRPRRRRRRGRPPRGVRPRARRPPRCCDSPCSGTGARTRPRGSPPAKAPGSRAGRPPQS